MYFLTLPFLHTFPIYCTQLHFIVVFSNQHTLPAIFILATCTCSLVNGIGWVLVHVCADNEWWKNFPLCIVYITYMYHSCRHIFPNYWEWKVYVLQIRVSKICSLLIANTMPSSNLHSLRLWGNYDVNHQANPIIVFKFGASLEEYLKAELCGSI